MDQIAPRNDIGTLPHFSCPRLRNMPIFRLFEVIIESMMMSWGHEILEALERLALQLEHAW
jgi:hypothetical protein